MSLAAFVVLALLALCSALLVVLRPNPVVSALALAIHLVSIAGFYLLLSAQFIALLQIIVYAGAILVLILFVIMLLNLPHQAVRSTGSIQAWAAPALAATAAVLIGWAALRADLPGFPERSAEFGTVAAVGTALFREFFYAFEAISLLLVVAMVGAVLLAKKRI